MSTNLDQSISELAKKAAELGSQKDVPWYWKLAGSVLLAIWVWWLNSELQKKTRELSEARTQLEFERMNIERTVFLNKVRDIENQKVSAEAAARVHLMAIKATEIELTKQELEHKQRVAAIQSIKSNDWDAINKLAGVK